RHRKTSSVRAYMRNTLQPQGRSADRFTSAAFLPGPEAPLKIFFCGTLRQNWMSSWQRCQTLRELGHSVVEFQQDGYNDGAIASRLKRLATNCLYDDRVIDEFNHHFLTAVLAVRPQVAWIEWPVLLRRQTLEDAAARLPNCRWVAFQDDNPFGSRPGEHRRW